MEKVTQRAEVQTLDQRVVLLEGKSPQSVPKKDQ